MVYEGNKGCVMVANLDNVKVTFAGGDDEGRPPGGGLLVDGQLDLPRVQVAQDLLQRRHVPLGGHVVEHRLLLLQGDPSKW